MENFIVSARKYRPSTFATVIGQNSITNTLKNAIKNNQVAQAFLFTGPRGVGKTTCARIMAKTINCTSITPEGEACNQCQSCQSFNKSSSFNIFELDAASNNTVEDIRNLVDQVRIPPQQGYKVYIVDEVHMLSQSAFNAFLKTLEEPPAYAKFILATTEKHKILPTILSRCQIFDFRRIGVEDIANHLQFVAQSEDITAEPEALHIIAQKADGGLRDALSMFDQLVSYSGNNLTYEQVIENLNVLDYEYYFKITEHVLNCNISETLLTINEIIENGFEGQHFITGLGQHMRNLLVSKDAVTLNLLEASKSVKLEYYNQSGKCSIPFIMRSLDIINECDINYKTSNNKKLHLEVTLLKLCNLNNTQSTSANFIESKILIDKQSASIIQAPRIEAESSSEKIDNPTNNTDIPLNASESQNIYKQQETKLPVENSNIKVSSSKASSLSGLSLGNIISGEKKSENPQEVQKTNIETEESFGLKSFTESDLILIWERMAEQFSSESPLLHNTLLWKKPILEEGNIITICIENSIQEEEIFRNKPEIIRFLRKELHNDSITITIKVIESIQEERRPYTDTEKFEYIANKAPSLRKLKDQLGLDLEM